MSDAQPRRRRQAQGRDAAVGLALGWLGLLVGAALFANVLPLPGPTAMDFLSSAHGPSLDHLFGTDRLGRDVLSRCIHGARLSLVVGIAAPLVGLIVGGTLGLAAGYVGGKTEAVVNWAIDTLLTFPGLVLAIAVASFMGRGLWILVFTLGVLLVPAFARIARANTLSFARREFVLAAEALGCSNTRIIVKDILPNVLPPMLSFAFAIIGAAIVAEGALSFLGLGLPPPTPTWGGTIAEGREVLGEAPHVALFPALVMFLTILSINILGDALRRKTDVRGSAL